jgi:[methyl-Co(III) methanol-specific corrinoid protein]:coenzyme M methyltransferase
LTKNPAAGIPPSWKAKGGLLIPHICGRSLDRMGYIAQTGVAAFHFDPKNDAAESMRVTGNRVTLVGNINNPKTLYAQGPAEVRQEVFAALDAGVPLIAPERAIPLRTPIENLKEIPRAVRDWQREHTASN